MSSSSEDRQTHQVSLASLFWIFLKIGSVSFGGFMALISVITDTVVDKRQLLTHDELLDGISLANLLPGPQGVNCVAYVGYRLRGGPGAVVSMVGVLLPTMGLLMVLTSLYLTYASQVSLLGEVLAGFVPAVAAVVVSVVARMGRKVLLGRREWALALLAGIAMFLAPGALRLYVTMAIVVGYGFIGRWTFFSDTEEAPSTAARPLPWRRLLPPLLALGSILVVFLADPLLPPNGLLQIARTFSGLSLMLFGGGYVFIPMIQDVVVTNYGWLTTSQFLDGIAFSQVTPGPIMVIATFISQKVMAEQGGLFMGFAGAIVGTISIFAPPALLMVTASLALESIQTSRAIQSAMRAIRCGVVGMIAFAAAVILHSALPACADPMSMPAWVETVTASAPTLALFGASWVALVRYRIDVVWVIPAAGLAGIAIY